MQSLLKKGFRASRVYRASEQVAGMARGVQVNEIQLAVILGMDVAVENLVTVLGIMETR